MMRSVYEQRSKTITYKVMTVVHEQKTKTLPETGVQRTYTVSRFVPEMREKTVNYTVCKMVPERREKIVTYNVCRMISEQKHVE